MRACKLKYSTLATLLGSVLLAGCNGGTGSSTSGQSLSGEIASVSETNIAMKTNVVIYPSSVSHSNNLRDILKDNKTSAFSNPILGELSNKVAEAIGGKLGGLATLAAVNLLDMCGVHLLDDPAQAEFTQIESSLNDIENKLVQLNSSLNKYILEYENNTQNEYAQSFVITDTNVLNLYTNLAQNIFHKISESTTYTSSSLTQMWEDGERPPIDSVAAALLNKKQILKDYSDFPVNLDRTISLLSDDSASPYLASDGQTLLIQRNSDGNWTSSRQAPASNSGQFKNSLQASFNLFNTQNPMYGSNSITPQNLFLNKARWSQVVMTALFNDTVDLQRTYRIVEFIVEAKYSGDKDFGNLNLPSFMGNPKNKDVALDALDQIYRYKTWHLYQEAQAAIDMYSTGAKGSDITDFSIPDTCDNILDVGNKSGSGIGASSHLKIDLATFESYPYDYSWDGRSLTTKCTTISGASVTSSQDVVDMCESGQLINLNGNIYCAKYSTAMNNSIKTYINQMYHSKLPNMNIMSHKNIRVDIRGIEKDTQVIDWFNSADHLYFVNDSADSLHLRDGDPTNNYYVLMQDPSREYLYGEGYSDYGNNAAYVPFVYLACLPFDKNCNNSSPLIFNSQERRTTIGLEPSGNTNSFDFIYGN